MSDDPLEVHEPPEKNSESSEHEEISAEHDIDLDVTNNDEPDQVAIDEKDEPIVEPRNNRMAKHRSDDIEKLQAKIYAEDSEPSGGELPDDDEYLPLNKVRSNRKAARGKKIQKKSKKQQSSVTKKKIEKSSKEKENKSEKKVTIKEEEVETRIYQKSFARRVPMSDPLRETNGVLEVPPNIRKVKLVISSKKQKIIPNILEPITQLKEVDSNNLEVDESNFRSLDVPVFRKKSRSSTAAVASSSGSRRAPRRKAAPSYFPEENEDSSNSLDNSNFFYGENDNVADLQLKQEVPDEDGAYDGEESGYYGDLPNNYTEHPKKLNPFKEGNTQENILEQENDYEDFWANPNPDDDDSKANDSDDGKDKDLKTLDDYVVLESLRKKRKAPKKRLKIKHKMIKGEDGQPSEMVEYLDDQASENEEGEDPEWSPSTKIKKEIGDEEELLDESGQKIVKKLSSHDKPKSAADRKIYGCLFCEYMGRKQAWLLHLKTIHPEKNLVYCTYNKVCQMPFENDQQLRTHLESTHHKQIICSFEGCGRIFKKRANLREHRRIHFRNSVDPEDPNRDYRNRPERSYVCTFCGKKYRTRNGFRAHEAMVHTRKLKHKCTVEGCNAAFFYHGELAIHSRKHTGELPFTCSYCGARYISHATLAQHERAAHLQTEDTQCHICQKRLRKRNLPGHLKTHEGYDGIPCTVCGKEFPTIGGKNRHEKIHFEVKQHTCRFCGKSFVQKANMIAHERIHTGERPYKCKHCNEGFPQQTRRNQHEQTCKHRVIPFVSPPQQQQV